MQLETKQSIWGFAKIWNDSLDLGRPERKLEPREKIWASEIGGSMVDRYLKMQGTPPSNPPNARSMRKFESGNIWEAIIGYVLKRAGILLLSQEWLSHQYPGLLPVTGKLDFMAGGTPDYDQALNVLETEASWLPEFITRATLNIVNHFKKEYPNGLKKIVLEIKSCSSFMFEVYEKKGLGASHHSCQIFHYLKSKQMDEGHLVYVCRDDARILEIPVYNPSPIEDFYKYDIELMTGYIQRKEQPPLEKPIVFDDTLLKFSTNWKMAYSSYLSKLYGFENQFAFDETYKGVTERWNRVMKRRVEGKDMTANNLDVVEEIVKAGFDIYYIKKLIKEDK